MYRVYVCGQEDLCCLIWPKRSFVLDANLKERRCKRSLGEEEAFIVAFQPHDTHLISSNPF